ncbi:MAG: hypothetical protein LBJ48_02450, partial [Coriobacteriales bacterium]|nr:hypothetical protein [Coriobacteriales bacterium]
YIAKAEDKQWEARARDYIVAVRTVLDLEYAAGNIDEDYVATGNGTYSHTNFRYWTAGPLLADSSNFNTAIRDLLGQTHLDGGNSPTESVAIVGPDGATPWSSDGFEYYCGPEGVSNGKELVLVTFRVSGIPDTTSLTAYNDATEDTAYYDPNAGMKVYHVIIDIF